MALLSKIEFKEAVKNVPCKDIFHPWSDSCFKGMLIMSASMLKGSMKFFVISYMATILLKMRKNKKINFKSEFMVFWRSIAMSVMYGTIFVALHCLHRNILGEFKFYACFFIIPLLTGISLSIESPGRKNFPATTFLTGAIEAIYRMSRSQGSIKTNLISETMAFMALNGMLMYALRVVLQKNELGESPWFFTPLKIKPSETGIQRECSHEGICTRSLQKDLIKFGGIALLISSLKLVVMKSKNPSQIFDNFFKWNNWRLASFVGAYIGIYKGLSCYLCKTRGDSLSNTIIAGLVGGISYAINPNITVLCSLAAALLKVIGKEAKKKYNLPNLPYHTICFTLCNYYLLYVRGFHCPNCPKYIYNMLNLLTEGKAEEINERFRKIFNPYIYKENL